MSHATITRTGGYKLEVKVSPVAVPSGIYNLQLLSTLSSAKNPDEQRRVLDINLDARGVQELAFALLRAVEVAV
jgi:hypothetical protein